MHKKLLSVSSQAFIFLISLYFTFFLNISFWRFVYDKVSLDHLGMLVFACSLPFFIFIPLFWFFNLLTLPKIGKALIALLLIMSAAADYAMSYLGIVIDSDMIRNFAETNWREASDFITLRSVSYVVLLGVIPAVAVFFCNIRFSLLKQELKRRLGYSLLSLLLLGAFGGVSYKEYASFGRNNSQVRHYINTFNYIYAVGRAYQRMRQENRDFVILDPHPQREKKADAAPRLLVLIVGETARAKNFSLYGYDRKTNPLLERQSIVTFKDVSSCGTATAVSLPCLFSANARKDFDVTDARYTQNLLDLLQSAGYDVLWKDNDDGCKGVCDRVPHLDAKTGEQQKFCFGSYCHDDVLLAGLEQQIVSLKRDSVIVLHAMGSHGPTYYKRYPGKFKRFTPSCDTADLQNCSREQIVNTYDNTILYTDYLISSVIDLLKEHPGLESGMLYVSDHGESLGENNLYLHGFPYAMAPQEQKKVPMVLWLSEKLQKAMQINPSCLSYKAETGAYSHDNFFHSVLRLLSVRTPLYQKELDIFDGCIF